MLADDVFLRRLPAVLDRIERLRLESIVFSSDVLSHAYQSLREIAVHFDEFNSFSSRHRVALFSHVWTIVDQLHVLRQLIRAVTNGTPGPNQQNFINLSENATLMRNRMDHLSSLIGNLSAQKGMRAPLFGALTYFLVSPSQVRNNDGEPVVDGGTYVTITSGSVPDGKALFAVSQLQSNQPIPVPVGQFLLSAFDWTLNIDAAISSIENTLTRMAAKVEADLMDQMKAESARTGVELSTLKAPLPMSNLAIAMKVSFIKE